MKLKPKSEESHLVYVADEVRKTITTDITYRAMDLALLKKYFPSIYRDVVKDKKLMKRYKGSKE